MKLVKEHINEKFEEDTDPIKDMCIGIDSIIKDFIKLVNKQHGIDVGITNTSYEKLLKWGAYFNRFDIVDYAIDHVSDINLDGETLCWAACAYNTDMGVYLVKRGADFAKGQKQAMTCSAETEKGMRMIETAIHMHKKVNEKFTLDTDPIRDMGIGLYHKRDFSSNKELQKWLLEYIPAILKTDKIPDDIINPANHVPAYPWKYYTPIQKFIEKYLTVNGSFASFVGLNHICLKQTLLKMGYPKKPLDEKFTQDSDPIHDMGIGRDVIRTFDSSDELVDWFIDNITMILKTNEIPNDILSTTAAERAGILFNTKYFGTFSDYVNTYLRIKNSRNNTFINFYDIKHKIHEKLLELGFKHTKP